jgi:hypothetical protein
MGNGTNDKAANEAKMNDLLAQMAKLQAENARLAEEAKAAKKAATAALSIAVSSKGAVSVYGLGRFPVTLYADGWKRLAGKMADVMAFVDEAVKLGAVSTGKGIAFVQPNGLPLKFIAKVAKEEPKARTTSAL